MTSFFVQWQLWQQMTFVLACCIAIVFLIGLVKLWQNNRELRKYEVLDEERRSRMTDMKHCGIRHLSYSNVPFGVRAIERGVEVEGIWIAGSGPAVAGRDASSASAASASAVQDSIPAVPGGRGTVYYSLEDAQHKVGESSSSPLTRTSAPSQPPSAHPVAGCSDYAVERKDENRCVPATTDGTAYRPSGSERLSLQGSERSFTLSPQQVARHRPRSRAVSLDSSVVDNLQNTRQVYGSAQVFVNRTHRRLKAGFEVLPAGTFGARSEFAAARLASRPQRHSIELQTRPTPSKLQKQRR
ncbi:uncharacterized protein MAM_02004 [Metarhizium album ARSEF 1941]|uniref:Uncharacterized protein n=1 Tax=Metarhizium album (strain ARSEF 1941) TaxID=1081103 RepID=A0A0B2X446_METAS|nr:uncharacterized protein MAM_02004 [Metarhizium album ARSEF 1941]KHO00081.1 hypothetical protein MAM_02004 [Metarhizium album ARSEF 1941]